MLQLLTANRCRCFRLKQTYKACQGHKQWKFKNKQTKKKHHTRQQYKFFEQKGSIVHPRALSDKKKQELNLLDHF